MSETKKICVFICQGYKLALRFVYTVGNTNLGWAPEGETLQPQSLQCRVVAASGGGALLL